VAAPVSTGETARRVTDSTRSVILVSNDDGIHAPGIAALAKALDPIGEVWVVAPDRERSAVGHALTLHRPIVADQLGPRRFAVNGTPSDCVNLALLGLLPVRPHIVVAGVNAGSNLGDDVTYSGTVSAAMEGTLLGVPGLAVSLVKPTGPESYRPAARAAAQLVRRLLRERPGGATLVNVNVPPGEPRGIKVTRLGRRLYSEKVVERQDPRGRRYFWIGAGPPAWESGEDTDYAAVHAGYVSVTPLMLDLTDYAALRTVKDWEMEYRRAPRKRGPSRAGR
jgi:5'-nucleotidase